MDNAFVDDPFPVDPCLDDPTLAGCSDEPSFGIDFGDSSGSGTGASGTRSSSGTNGGEGPSSPAATAHQSVAELAHIDGLTQLHNRRRLDEDLPETLAQCRADGAPVCFAMLDVDHFKAYNDTHGHGAGDVALQLVAETIRTNVREQDVVYRYGGEEFSILLPDTDLAEAGEVAERVRNAIEDAVFVGEDRQPGGRVTVSVGMAQAGTEDPESLRHRADEALYEAKESGRNRVTVAG